MVLRSKLPYRLFIMCIFVFASTLAGMSVSAQRVAAFNPPLDSPVHLRLKQEVKIGRQITTGRGGFVVLVYTWKSRDGNNCEGWWYLGGNSSGRVPDMSKQDCEAKTKDAFSNFLALAESPRSVSFWRDKNISDEVPKTDQAPWEPSTWSEVNWGLFGLPRAARGKVLAVTGSDLVVEANVRSAKEIEEHEIVEVQRLTMRSDGVDRLKSVDLQTLVGQDVYIEYLNVQTEPARLLDLYIVGSDEFYRRFGFHQRKSDDCSNVGQDETCIRFEDGEYLWLVRDKIQDTNRFNSPFGYTVNTARGERGEYQRVRGKEWVKFVRD
jgi:hypothetical protein